MRQIKLGEWPAKTFAAGIAELQRYRVARDAGGDPAVEKRQKSGSGEAAWDMKATRSGRAAAATSKAA